MKSTEAVLLVGRSALLERAGDYLELTKPRIGILVLLTVAAGAFTAARGAPDVLVLLNVLIGTALVAAGSSALNQWSERKIDAQMNRTADRPLPAGRLRPAEALAFGLCLSAAGTIYLALAVNLAATLVALVSLVFYVWLYTPLKKISSLNTMVGAIPGALPTVIGAVAITGNVVRLESWLLFLLVFFWQFPHFLAIAWLYRRDYARAGLRMLPTTELGRRLVGLQMVSYSAVLIPISLLPSYLGIAGPIYFFGALVLGIQFFGYAVAFLVRRTDERARALLWVSLLYLPMVLGLLMLDLIR